MMRIIKGKPASGKPPRIICTGCGKEAFEAGIAVEPRAVEHGYGNVGPVMIVDDDTAQPLCAECVAILSREGDR